MNEHIQFLLNAYNQDISKLTQAKNQAIADVAILSKRLQAKEEEIEDLKKQLEEKKK